MMIIMMLPLKKYKKMSTSYLSDKFTRHMNNVDVIIECGAMDCNDTLQIYNYYSPKKIYSFECNPENIEMCKENIKNTNINLIEKALYDKDCKVYFFITDLDKSLDKNRGASSLLYHKDNKVEYIQRKIEVDAIRLDTFLENEKIDKVDLLTFDLQGSENIALSGLGERIKDVHYIISEVNFETSYEDGVLFDEINLYLSEHNFEFIDIENYGPFGDALFINKNY